MVDPLSLIKLIAKNGRESPSNPILNEVEPFSHFFNHDGFLDIDNLDKRDGLCSRREILIRFLALCAVVDQGPDIIGVHRLLIDVTNQLYRNEIRFLHTPVEFFREIGCAVDTILNSHTSIKEVRSLIWAAQNQSNPTKYNLFMDNAHQALSYAVFRWGVPLALPLLLQHDNSLKIDVSNLLLDYLESWPSAEIMSQQFKDHERYGLGKAIGDKASHLFAKWITSSYPLVRRKEKSWGTLSYEVPYDSNAGRVLWRSGYFLNWVSEEELVRNQVIQIGQGKQGLNYIRVTNIRGIKTNKEISDDIWENYIEVSTNYLKTHSRKPKKAEIQRIQHAYLLMDFDNSGYGVSDFDDGLMYIGTNFCFNHSEPKCTECPISDLCDANRINPRLITNYRT